MNRLFDHLLDGAPFVYCEAHGNRLEMTIFVDASSARPEDEVVYIETPAFRRNRERLKKEPRHGHR